MRRLRLGLSAIEYSVQNGPGRVCPDKNEETDLCSSLIRVARWCPTSRCRKASSRPSRRSALLLSPEFVKQTLAIGLCVAAAGLSYPLWRTVPGWLVAGMLVVLALVAIGPMLASFRQLRGPLDAIYGRPIEIGRGPLEMTVGFAALCAGYVLALSQAGGTGRGTAEDAKRAEGTLGPEKSEVNRRETAGSA